MKTSIAILICYFGKFPWYFRYYLHSCRYNPDIDFMIISDIEWKDELPPNVRIIKRSIDEVKTLAGEKLGFPVKIDFPYKFCDFKPAYGLIFSELIEGYVFWGQSDIDIIYGNIRRFFTDEVLAQYDFLSVRHDYTTGCFALYRNNELMNNIFKRSRDYVKVFSGNKHYCFDECSFVQDLLTDGSRTIFEIETEVESFTHIIRAASGRGEIRAFFDFILLEGLPGKIRFDKGKILYKNKFEAILYHLYWLKDRCKDKGRIKRIPESYKISPTRIYQ